MNFRELKMEGAEYRDHYYFCLFVNDGLFK